MLQGIGLTLEDALTFWKSEFTKGATPSMARSSSSCCLCVISCAVSSSGEAEVPVAECVLLGSTPADKFDKEYAYTVRYNYGKEGRRTDWSPYSCMKIINSAPAAGAGEPQHHRTYLPQHLLGCLLLCQLLLLLPLLGLATGSPSITAHHLPMSRLCWSVGNHSHFYPLS